MLFCCCLKFASCLSFVCYGLCVAGCVCFVVCLLFAACCSYVLFVICCCVSCVGLCVVDCCSMFIVPCPLLVDVCFPADACYLLLVVCLLIVMWPLVCASLLVGGCLLAVVIDLSFIVC